MTTKKMTLLASIGAGLEYYDFVIYGLLATYIGQVFFPSSDYIIGILKAFSVFALGYLARPVGGIILGNLGDRIGRKPIFLFSLILMAFATLMIGLLPSYNQIGLSATVILILLRILQGLAFGSEIPGTITFVIEHTEKKHRGINTGVALASVSLGASLGTGLIFLLEKFLTTVQMSAYGWRVPFILGGLLAIVSFFIRKKLQETPEFLALQEELLKPAVQPIFQLLRHHLKPIILGICISLFTACFIIFGISLPAYLQQFYGYQSTSIYLFISLGFIWSAIALPLFGWIADKVGRINQLAVTAALLMLAGFILFQLLDLQTIWALGLFMFVYHLLVAALANCYLSTLAELFPTSVRFTGTALCYNIVYSIAGFTPLVLMRFGSIPYGMHYVYLIFVFLSALTVIGALMISLKPKTVILPLQQQ